MHLTDRPNHSWGIEKCLLQFSHLEHTDMLNKQKQRKMNFIIATLNHLKGSIFLFIEYLRNFETLIIKINISFICLAL